MLILAPDLITTTSAFALVVFGLAEMVRILQLQPICYFCEWTFAARGRGGKIQPGVTLSIPGSVP